MGHTGTAAEGVCFAPIRTSTGTLDMSASGGPAPTVLITGSARRIGRAIALEPARSGWQVCVHCRRSAGEAEAVVSEIQALGGKAVALAADLASQQDVDELIPRCRAVLGAPLCLINNASEFLVDSVATATPGTWDTHLDIDLKAPVFLAKSLFLNLPDGAPGMSSTSSISGCGS